MLLILRSSLLSSLFDICSLLVQLLHLVNSSTRRSHPPSVRLTFPTLISVYFISLFFHILLSSSFSPITYLDDLLNISSF